MLREKGREPMMKPNYFHPDDPCVATRTTFEGGPAYLLAGHPETLRALVDYLPAGCDTTLDPKGAARICTVFGMWSRQQAHEEPVPDAWRARLVHEEIADDLRRASDLAGIDVVFSILGAPDDTLKIPAQTIRALVEACGAEAVAS